LRDFATLSDREIQNWGRTRTLVVHFCEFREVVLTVRMDAPLPMALPKMTDINGNAVSPVTWLHVYQSIMRQFDQQKWSGVPARIDAEVYLNILVNGHPPAATSFRARMRRISETVRLASVFEYADPITATSDAAVGRYELGDSEIIENCDEVAMVIDLSSIVVPDSCCF
jgi:hypothetical protein